MDRGEEEKGRRIEGWKERKRMQREKGGGKGGR